MSEKVRKPVFEVGMKVRLKGARASQEVVGIYGAHPEKYRLRNGCEVVAIRPNPDGGWHVTYLDRYNYHQGINLDANGGWCGSQSNLDMIPLSATIDPEAQA